MRTKLAAAAAVAALAALGLTGTAAAKTYYAKVGPGFTITFKNAAGKTVSRIPAGTHTIKVKDRGSIHNFHLKGPGVNKKTGVSFVGSRTWKLHFVAGRYRYRCDPHRDMMHGSFRAV